ncbi:iron complex transport system ATP-binding protein [Ketogulonicigenium robustum]|uniref:Iron complex transport system ATP-binding protein n=1 Tax=Ketogulonicigenium robustum TaxID=92947 RepID=A0A1W6NXF3_9RHOB|nr:ABC transporter ATP-binding protein [Ketogulonicigenium robustum]ARO13869.1 iron complex transport system ATP-binding protein [Ketogulonicigenium robustum]
MTILSLENLSNFALRDVSFSVASGECVGLIGPNGAGKTTLLRAALGLTPCSGQSSLARLPSMRRARAAAFLPQERTVAWPLTARNLIALGRMPYDDALQPSGQCAILDAMARLDLQPLADRVVSSLSGGEQARVLLARALAQTAPLLLADEPTANLDPAAQYQAMEVLAAEAQAGRAVVASLHDLGLAARYCTRLIVLQHGAICADGPPQEVLKPALLADVFGIRATLIPSQDGAVFSVIGRV